MSTNLVMFSGRLGRDPEVRATGSGKTVAGFSLAVDDGYGDTKTTLWLSVEAWGKTGEAVSRFLTKGNRAIVVGRLKEDSWEADGVRKTRMKVIADRVEVIDFPEKERELEAVGVSDEDSPF